MKVEDVIHFVFAVSLIASGGCVAELDEGSLSASVVTPHYRPWRGPIADFNADGYADLANVDLVTGKFWIRHQLADRTFGEPVEASLSVAPGTGSWETFVADFDNDGFADYADHDLTNGHFFIHENRGNGTFYSHNWGQGVAHVSPDYETLIGDFNADGFADFADHNVVNGRFYIHLNDKHGAFEAANWGIGYTSDDPVNYETLVADFDGDGYTDFADRHRSSGTFYVHRNRTDGTFDSANWTIGTSTAGDGWTTLVGNFTGHHMDERQADYADWNTRTGELWVHRQFPRGTFEPQHANWTVGRVPSDCGFGLLGFSSLPAGMDPATAQPRITSTILEPTPSRDASGNYRVQIGYRYDVKVHVAPGRLPCDTAVQWNTQLGDPPPPHANVTNFRADSLVVSPANPSGRNYYFTVTAEGATVSQIGFMLWNAAEGAKHAFRPDGGITIKGESAMTGIYGRISHKGFPVASIAVQLDGDTIVSSDASGMYRFHAPGGGLHTIRVIPAAWQPYSPTKAINVPAPAAGINVDLDVEDQFIDNQGNRVDYTRYFDYLYGRTLLHVVRVNKSSHSVQVAGRIFANGQLATAEQAAAQLNAVVLINGGYGVADSALPSGGYNQGYAYLQRFSRDDAHPYLRPGQKGPVLGISGTSTNQFLRIAMKDVNFDYGTDWNRLSDGNVLWDDDRNGVSDVDWALQAGPELIPVPPVSRDPGSDFNSFWARTSLGLTAQGAMYIVVADGEGLTNRQGASMFQLGQLYQNHLGAVSAMNLDGGGSTLLILKDASGVRRQVNFSTSEDVEHPYDGTPLHYVNYVVVR